MCGTCVTCMGSMHNSICPSVALLLASRAIYALGSVSGECRCCCIHLGALLWCRMLAGLYQHVGIAALSSGFFTKVCRLCLGMPYTLVCSWNVVVSSHVREGGACSAVCVGGKCHLPQGQSGFHSNGEYDGTVLYTAYLVCMQRLHAVGWWAMGAALPCMRCCVLAQAHGALLPQVFLAR
ncbi:hypothetical protein COO60DRAFT_1095791 [Scenedesmus sp. NREL 46B-D3]|nr:hypothetical protein COO60DRAFT_1095791 [Scenedesmus sp. NREL 46B-D3]